MIINYKSQNGKLILEFTPEEGEPKIDYLYSTIFKTTNKVEMNSTKCEIHLPSDWTIKDIHPDVFALAILAIIYPFCGPKIQLPLGVSKSFHNLVMRVMKKRILPINEKLSLRKAPTNAKPALTFSGGIDSTAAAILLPEDTHLVYVDRMLPKGVTKTLLNQESAYYACKKMTTFGRSVHRIKTDMQYIRKPVGFGSYLADAVPALLLADYYGYDSIAHGQTLEIGYQVGHLGFKDCKETEVGYPWFRLLAAVDMTYTLPTIGLSEVNTTKIVLNSPYHEFAQACSRGKVKQPCMNCFKCFRKDLLEKVITNDLLEDKYLDRLFHIKEVKRVIQTEPIYFSNILAYITANYTGHHQEMLALKKKVRGDVLDVDWMNQWYSKSQEFFAPKYRSYVKQKILKFTKPMSTKDINAMQQSFSKTYFNQV